jgi:hypothetical protein
MRIPRRLSLTLYACLAFTTLAVAHPGDRKTLVVRGRTIDAGGFPIPKTRVWVDGLHKVSMVSDADGRFSLELPIGSPEEIRSKAVRLAVRAERKGWRFAIPGGDPMLALELGLEPGAGGNTQCVARSNVDRFAASAAQIVAIDGAGAGLMEINFLGAKSEATVVEAWPTLSQTARAALDSPMGDSAPASGPAVQSAPSPAALAAPQATSSAETSAGGPGGTPTENGTGTTSPASPPTGSSAAKASGAAAGTQKAAKTKSKNAAASEAEQELSRIRVSAARDSVKAAKRAAAGSGDPVAAVQERARIALERAARITASDRDTGEAAAHAVVPAPGSGGSRSRSAPLVIRAARRLMASASDSCECRITGTVEVESDKPLKRPERVEVSLVWHPEVRDTVELFMGSPRPFELGPTRCGLQRLRLKVLTPGRFDVRSPDAMAGFRCDGDRVVEQRVVLVPR